MNERIRALRERALTTGIGPNAEWTEHWRQSMAATEGQPPLIREARAWAACWAGRSIAIGDGELLVGARPDLCHGDAPAEVSCFGRRSFAPAAWFPMPDGLGAWFAEGMVSLAGNHTTVDYDGILSGGFEGLLERIDRRQARLAVEGPDAEPRRQFLEAMAIVAHGYLHLCRRYADLADALARQTDDSQRRRELTVVAENCRRVPALPPRTFWEACQSAWFAFMFVADAPGRLDQYLRPFYERDIAREALSRDAAKELLSCLWLKYYAHCGAAQGVSAIYHMTLGGQTPTGADASSDLTWLCLETTEYLRLHRPQVGLRWHRGTPPALLERAVRVLRTRSGNPDFCSDEQIVPALTNIGVRIEDARDFSLSGCHEVIITGRAQMGSVEGFVNMPKILRLTLGLEPALGPGADLSAITSAHRLWQALSPAMERVADAVHRISLARDSAAARSPNLCASLVVNDCIENAMGYSQGGARYNFCNWNTIGLANLADSLQAIETLVFDRGLLSLAELVAAVRSNWEGLESLRQTVLRHSPHFGNDQDSVDRLAVGILEQFAGILQQFRPFRGGQYILGTTAGGENMHVEFGRVTGATPDGRRGGEPLADSMGASQGRDVRGVTALLNSVSRLPHGLLPTASTLNVKIDPKLLHGDGTKTLAALIQAHFQSGGQQIQFNLVDRAALIEARDHPERHGDLMVRVAGYSAPFTCLWPDLQDEIIARTEHGVG